MKILLKSPLFLLFLAITANSSDDFDAKNDATTATAAWKIRTKRGVFWDFFHKVVTTKNLVVDQYSDTKNTLNEIYNLFNEQFTDPGPVKPTIATSSTTVSSNDSGDESTEMTTTTEKYRISRYELGRIFGRNYRGLQRLMKIELMDAFNQSQYNIQEYKNEAQKQFANSLAVEKKKKLLNLNG